VDLSDSVNVLRTGQPCRNLTDEELQAAKRRNWAVIETAMQRPELPRPIQRPSDVKVPESQPAAV